MGKGIDLARGAAPLHAAVLDDFKDQLLIVLLRRLGALENPVLLPVEEVDDTGQLLCSFKIVDRVFHFGLHKKS